MAAAHKEAAAPSLGLGNASLKKKVKAEARRNEGGGGTNGPEG